MIKIIFVCHGNICRSPAAEFVFNHLIKTQNLESKYECYSRALTDDEIGHDTYEPMKQALNKIHMPFYKHCARRLDDLDIQYCDYIVYMDDENKFMLDNDYNIDQKKLINLAQFVDQNQISDPWFHRGFDGCLSQIVSAVKNLLKYLEK